MKSERNLRPLLIGAVSLHISWNRHDRARRRACGFEGHGQSLEPSATESVRDEGGTAREVSSFRQIKPVGCDCGRRFRTSCRWANARRTTTAAPSSSTCATDVESFLIPRHDAPCHPREAGCWGYTGTRVDLSTTVYGGVGLVFETFLDKNAGISVRLILFTAVVHTNISRARSPFFLLFLVLQAFKAAWTIFVLPRTREQLARCHVKITICRWCSPLCSGFSLLRVVAGHDRTAAVPGHQSTRGVAAKQDHRGRREHKARRNR